MARLALLTGLALLALGGIARGEALVPVDGSLSQPMSVTSPPDDARLFVVERTGAIRIVKDGVVQPTPFLTVPDVATDVERGLSSMAFAPDYTMSGVFYVFTTFSDPGQPDDGQIRIVEYHRSSSDVADANSARVVLKRDHPDGNHYGGQLAFGPDGYLYITMGDGGTGGPNGQDTKTTLGKVLRIDPHPTGGAPYGIPPDNPFAGNALCGPGDGSAPCPEIYAYGFRNPFRASFDPPTGDLILGDVGEDTWEEMDLVHAGDNFGWGDCEGDFARGSTTTPCPIAQTPPFFSYTHADSHCAVIGGYVVHDRRLPALDGRYLYGDLCRADLSTLDVGAPGGDPQPAGLSVGAPNTLFSFGQDADGCVYVVAGTVYRIAAASGDQFTCPGPPPSTGGRSNTAGTGSTAGGSATTAPGVGSTPAPPLLADVTAPTVRLARSRAQRLRRDVRVGATCDESCDLLATGALRFTAGAAASRRLRPARAHADAGAAVTLRLRLSTRQRVRARRVLRGGGRVTAAVTVTARDAAGNVRRRTVRIPLR